MKMDKNWCVKMPRYGILSFDHWKGKDPRSASHWAGGILMGRAVDLVIFTVSPEIEANLFSIVNMLGREIWGWVRNIIMSSAYIQSLKWEDSRG